MNSLWLQFIKNFRAEKLEVVGEVDKVGLGQELIDFEPLAQDFSPPEEDVIDYMGEIEQGELALIQISSCGHVIAS